MRITQQREDIYEHPAIHHGQIERSGANGRRLAGKRYPQHRDRYRRQD
jgi:hypothetical protein